MSLLSGCTCPACGCSSINVLDFCRGLRDHLSPEPHPEEESCYLCALDKLIYGDSCQEGEYGIDNILGHNTHVPLNNEETYQNYRSGVDNVIRQNGFIGVSQKTVAEIKKTLGQVKNGNKTEPGGEADENSKHDISGSAGVAPVFKPEVRSGYRDVPYRENEQHVERHGGNSTNDSEWADTVDTFEKTFVRKQEISDEEEDGIVCYLKIRMHNP